MRIRLILVTFLICSFNLSAQDKSCPAVLQQSLARYIMKKADLNSPLLIRREFCSSSAKIPYKNGEHVLFKRRMRVSDERYRIMKKIFCKNISIKRAAKLYVPLKRAISFKARQSFKRCRAFRRNGGVFQVNSLQAGLTPRLNFNISTGADLLLNGIATAGEEEAFECTHTARNLQNTRFTSYPFIGSCDLKPNIANVDRRLVFDTNIGNIGFDFPALFDANQGAFNADDIVANLNNFNVNIQDCHIFDGQADILECVTVTAYNNCLSELIAGNLRDCRANVPANVNPVFPYEELPAGGLLSKNSSLHIEVFHNSKGTGNASGIATYTMNITIPSRPAAVNCDPDCPVNTCGNNPCNRNCVKADGKNEDITGDGGGLFAISQLQNPSCSYNTELSGEFGTDSIDLYRAYEACERGNAWGGNTSIKVIKKLGKLFQFNNPTAYEIPGGWYYENTADLVYAFNESEFTVIVDCNN